MLHTAVILQYNTMHYIPRAEAFSWGPVHSWTRIGSTDWIG